MNYIFTSPLGTYDFEFIGDPVMTIETIEEPPFKGLQYVTIEDVIESSGVKIMVYTGRVAWFELLPGSLVHSSVTFIDEATEFTAEDFAKIPERPITLPIIQTEEHEDVDYRTFNDWAALAKPQRFVNTNASWKDKKPAEILDDINKLLTETWSNSPVSPYDPLLNLSLAGYPKEHIDDLLNDPEVDFTRVTSVVRCLAAPGQNYIYRIRPNETIEAFLERANGDDKDDIEILKPEVNPVHTVYVDAERLKQMAADIKDAHLKQAAPPIDVKPEALNLGGEVQPRFVYYLHDGETIEAFLDRVEDQSQADEVEDADVTD